LTPVPFLLASITGPLVSLATSIIRNLGLAGVLALTAITGVIGVPGTEPTMLFAGFNVYQHHLSLVGIIIAGAIGDVIGASIAYAIGYFGSQELLEHQGSKLHVNQRALDRAHRWFDQYGAPVVLVSRLIPFVRAAFPYAAGVARMSYLRFVSLAALGSLIWIGALGVLGRAVGRSWESWRHHLEYADYAAVAIVVVAIVLFLVRRRRRRGVGPVSADAPPDAEAASVDVVSR
jgi:membrane protein DedA with SNARE-associated domain